MKYVDLRAIRIQTSAKRKALNDSIQDAIKATYEEERPVDAATREWSLGMLQQERWYPACELIVSFSGFDHGEDPVPQLLISYSVPDYRVRTISYWTAEQIDQLAEIRRVLDRWIKGEIDNLPPSGKWAEVKPS